MENLRILAENLNQKNEIIGMFSELGYKKESFYSNDNDNLMGLHLYEDGYIQDVIDEDYDDKNHKQITLPELRDLVVLKRNSIEDATHEGTISGKYYVSSSNRAYRFDLCWVSSNYNEDDIKNCLNQSRKP